MLQRLVLVPLYKLNTKISSEKSDVNRDPTSVSSPGETKKRLSNWEIVSRKILRGQT